MSDLISRRVAIDAFERFIHELGIKDEPYNYGEIALSAQNVPSAENKGKWIEDEDIDVNNDGKFAVKCSKCGEYNGYRKTNFCPNCGADMRVSEREERNRKIIIDMLKDMI